MPPSLRLLLAAAAGALLLARAADGAALDSFLAPLAGRVALNADFAPVSNASTAEGCAARCLSLGARCVSFNLCGGGAPLACGVSEYSMAYDFAAAASCELFTRLQPRDDSPAGQAVAWAAQAPAPRAVALNASGLLGAAFAGHRDTYLGVRSPLDMLFFFYKRANVAPPDGAYCFGWGEWIKGSETGNFLLGAGSYLQHKDDPVLAARVQQVVDGIAQLQEADGWIWAFNETDISADNLPDYCAGWVTRGLLDADRGGASGAYALARQQISIFNNHSALAHFLPPNGGPNPVQPFPSGFNNVTNGGYGNGPGHMIYIQYQGMIKHSLMALSRGGTRADVKILEELYVEQWWLDALLRGDEFGAIWHRTFFSHNYEVTAYEALLDLYVVTGNATYRDAVMSAWRSLRARWILRGGSFALNEGSYYPPSSYYIGFTGTNVASAHSHLGRGSDSHAHGHAHAHAYAHSGDELDDDGFYHAPCMPGPVASDPPQAPLAALRAAAKEPAEGLSGPNDGDPPTGELCGNVFWAKLNERLHHLEPDNETFVSEIERSIINVGLAALGRPGSGGQGPNGTGIRYFANQHKQKQNPSMHASCCEGQGTRLFGSLPEFVFSVQGGASSGVSSVYVDLYTPATLSVSLVGSIPATLTVDTLWPYDSRVAITLSLPAATSSFDLAVRIPSWLAAPVALTLNGAAWPAQGVPGTYLHFGVPAGGWPAGASVVAFDLPLAWSAELYSGSSQLPPYARWSFLLGPVLMSLEGPWDAPSDSLVMPAGLDPSRPQDWLVPASDGNALHFAVRGNAAFTAKPYFEVQDAGERFSNYPCFAKAAQ